MQVVEFKKLLSILASFSIVLFCIFITLILISTPIATMADGILLADYPDAAFINDSKALF